ncbi:hypothetical protein A6V39_03355 [Candidatus Mycoplasma haematobovis]|uniref:Uncharacterized protein n=1 Tax=Candidatus Mycoplasma haematobovis TaxID=432608 RepID=A0A1A9QBF8_9MOLU|nr:hypothetical protein [Candidatus Mycoplasma haematobovis]OAL09922.1 hypothetical protein A6V39_03355 [Candidatus Mycoplasma haematobovis]
MNKVLGIVSGVAGLGSLGGGVTYLVLNNNSQTPKTTIAETQLPEESSERNSLLTPANTGKKISEWLSGKGKSILTDEAPEWSSRWASFKESYTVDKEREEPWKLSDWKTVFGQSEVPQSFKEKCKANANTKVDSINDSLYTEIEKYCTK